MSQCYFITPLKLALIDQYNLLYNYKLHNKIMNYDIPILTGNQDTDALILRQLDIKDLYHLCQTNKYINDICHTKSFFINKMSYDYLPIFLIKNDVNYDWMKTYRLLERIKIISLAILQINNIEFNRKENNTNGIINIDFIDVNTTLSILSNYKDLPFGNHTRVIFQYVNTYSYIMSIKTETDGGFVVILQNHVINDDELLVLIQKCYYNIFTRASLAVVDERNVSFKISSVHAVNANINRNMVGIDAAYLYRRLGIWESIMHQLHYKDY